MGIKSKRKIFDSFKFYCKLRHNKRLIDDHFMQIYHLRLLTKSIQCWREFKKMKGIERSKGKLAILQWSQRLKKVIMAHLKQYSVKSKRKKQEEVQALELHRLHKRADELCYKQEEENISSYNPYLVSKDLVKIGLGMISLRQKQTQHKLQEKHTRELALMVKFGRRWVNTFRDRRERKKFQQYQSQQRAAKFSFNPQDRIKKEDILGLRERSLDEKDNYQIYDDQPVPMISQDSQRRQHAIDDPPGDNIGRLGSTTTARDPTFRQATSKREKVENKVIDWFENDFQKRDRIQPRGRNTTQKDTIQLTHAFLTTGMEENNHLRLLDELKYKSVQLEQLVAQFHTLRLRTDGREQAKLLKTEIAKRMDEIRRIKQIIQ